MGHYHDHRFPGESEVYRRARDELLAREIELRKQLEAVAGLRRRLPLGGRLKEDYVFEERGGAAEVRTTPLSALFEPGKKSLVVYSFMYAPDAANACPSCSSLLDGLDGAAPHIRDKINFVVVAKAPVEKIDRWAERRGWRHLRLLSSGGNSYNRDYCAETPGGAQLPAINVFTKTDDGIFHSYNQELLYAPAQQGQHPRHADSLWPVWAMFDLTPEGRGVDWYPKNDYR